MNHIDITFIKTQCDNYENYWTIDGVALPILLDSRDKDLDVRIKSFVGLCPAWNLDLKRQGDVQFVWELIELEHVMLPLLLNSEERDFTDIVIVVDVDKTKDFIYWDRIGYVLHLKVKDPKRKK